jgi:hypothetical protein
MAKFSPMPVRYFAVLVLWFSACAATNWSKQGATKADFANDKQFCSLYARNINENYSLMRQVWTDKIFDECMSDKGWEKQK